MLANWVLVALLMRVSDAATPTRPRDTDHPMRHDPGGAGRMNARCAVVAVACLACSAAAGNMNYLQVCRGQGRSATKPGNARTLRRSTSTEARRHHRRRHHGRQVGAHHGPDKYRRTYPGADVYAPVDRLRPRLRATGIEAAETREPRPVPGDPRLAVGQPRSTCITGRARSSAAPSTSPSTRRHSRPPTTR